MKLTKGKKPETINIPSHIPHIITTTGNYTEIDIDDSAQIIKLKSQGFK